MLGLKKEQNSMKTQRLPAHENDQNSKRVKSVYLLVAQCTPLLKTPSVCNCQYLNLTFWRPFHGRITTFLEPYLFMRISISVELSDW